jgi:hypothetical protein
MFRISLCVCAFLPLAYGVLPLAAQSAAASANAVSPPPQLIMAASTIRRVRSVS